ncbi:MAG TPA: EamA family transporter [Methanocorpusculum sp.]|nr:EamA family transporter [Methanocorpusculum sp.]
MFTTAGNKSTAAAILMAVVSGVLFAFLTPLSAVFLEDVQPVFTVAALNLGAGLGMALLFLLSRKTKRAVQCEKIAGKDKPILICIIIGDFFGALFSMLSLTFAAADSVSLILNFEIVSTALIAFCFFKEKVSKRLGAAIVLVTLGCLTITAGDLERFIASPGILLALASCVCWGITHNLYRKVSYHNPNTILTVRGIGIGVIALILSLVLGEEIPGVTLIVIMMLIGFATYGLGNVFFVLAQRKLGAAMVSAISGFSPFLAAVISLIIFRDSPTVSFAVALLLLIPGVYLAVSEGVLQERAAVSCGDGVSMPAPKADIRNILSAMGYFVIASTVCYFAISAMNLPFMQDSADASVPFALCCSGFLLLIGVVLIILRNRDFDGITFVVMAIMMLLFATVTGNAVMQISLGIFQMILGGIFLLARERKKYVMSILLIIHGLSIVISLVFPDNIPVVLASVLTMFLIIIGILSTGQLPKIPLTKILTAPESTSFKVSGAMIGYFFFGFSMVQWILLYLTGTPAADEYTLFNVTVICTGALLLIGLLMIFVGKSWFTGGIFLGLAFVQTLTLTGFGAVFFVAGITTMLFGLLSVLRKPSYLLSGMMYIIYGISAFSSQSVSGIIQIQFIQVLLNVIPCLLAVYLAAAVFSRKRRLPLF